MGWFQYSRLWARFEGSRDGVKGIPEISEPEPASVEKELTSLGQESVTFTEEWLAQRKQKEVAKFKNAESRLITIREKKETVGQRVQQDRKELKAALQEKEKCLEQTDFGQIEASVLRWGIAIGDGILNAKCFEVLGVTKAESYLAATGIALAIPAAGKAAGIFLKRVFSKQDNWGERIGACILAALLPVPVFSSLSFLRDLFFQASDVAAVLHLNAGPTGLSRAFFGINYGLYVVIAFVTFFSHVPKLTSVKAVIKHAQRALKKDERKLKKLEITETTEQTRRNDSASKIDSLTERSYARAMGLHFSMLRRIFDVRKWNLRKRKTPKMPKSFKSIPNLFKMENPFHFFSPFKGSKNYSNGGLDAQNGQNDGMFNGGNAAGRGNAGDDGQK